MNTTKGKSVPEALRMIADWVEKGEELEISHLGKPWKPDRTKGEDSHAGNGGVFIHLGYVYRAKPKKPRIANTYSTKGDFKSIELTEEVKEACRAAGIEVDCD